MIHHRYFIWKNGAFIDCCSTKKTLMKKLTQVVKRSNPEDDEIGYFDHEENVFSDASELVDWKPMYKCGF